MAKTKSKKTFSKEQYMAWYESMLLMRRFEEKDGQLYGQQKSKDSVICISDRRLVLLGQSLLYKTEINTLPHIEITHIQ